MGFFDRFKKPKWKDKDPKVRLEGLKELDDKDIIINLAGNDSDWKVRSEAIEMIDDENVLSELYESETDPIVRMTIAGKITDSDTLADIVKKDPDDDVRSAAVENITSENLLLYVINNDPSVHVRKDATYRLAHVAEDMKVFEILSREGKPDDIKLIAMDLMANQNVKAMVENEPAGDKKTSQNKSFTYLKDLITSSEGEINLDFDIKIHPDESENYEDGIIIDRDLIFNGNDHKIDARKMARILNITENANVVLKNIIFLNATSAKNEAKGGAIKNESERLIVDNCQFKGNSLTAYRSGASAIYSTNSIIINNCLFEDNENEEYGSVHIRLKDGKKFAKFKNCIFKANHTNDGDASAINLHIDNSAIELVRCIFEDNVLNIGHGGACYFNGGDIDLKACDFKNNRVGEGDGSAIFKENYTLGQTSMNLEKCTFENNYADTPNGSNYYKGRGTVYSSDTFLICKRCTFKNNHAVMASGICNQNDDANIIRSTFENTDTKSGSVFLQVNEDANVSIENSQFKTNNADEKAIHIIGGFCTIRNSEFHSDKAHAIFNKRGNVHIYNSQFSSNFETIFNDNVIKIEADSNLESLIRNGNDAKPIMYLKEKVSDDIKGATYLDELIKGGGEQINLEHDIIFNENERNFYEGGIELDRDNLTIDGNDHTIDANDLSRVFYITGENITLKNITFKNGRYFKNRLDDEYCGGGVIYTIRDSSLSIIDCKFIENTSRSSGGVITSRGELISVNNCEFKDNFSKINGTITNCRNYVSLKKCCFKSNTGNKGTGISSVDGITTLKDTTFNDNISHHRGGGAINAYGGEFSIINSTFANNRIEYSFEGGGAIYNRKSLMKITKSHFLKNRASNGGAIYSDGGEIIINECNFDYNLAKNKAVIGKGDAIYNNSEKGMIIKKSTFDSPTKGIIDNCGNMDIFSSRFNNHHEISNENNTIKIHSELLKRIIKGGNIELIENDDESIICAHDQQSADEYKKRFIEAVNDKNSNLTKNIADEWISEYPNDYNGHYAYVIANIDGDVNDLQRHINEAFACTPSNEFGKSKFETEANRAMVHKYGDFVSDFEAHLE